MKEVKIKDNKLGLKILVSDMPKIENIPTDILNLLFEDIEKEILSLLEKKQKKSKWVQYIIVCKIYVFVFTF